MSANTSAQQLMLLGTLQRCVVLLGSLWQAGFAAVHAPEGQLKPSLPRLADSVEELLWAPTTALGLAHDSAMQKSPLLNGALLRVRLVCVQTPVLSGPRVVELEIAARYKCTFRPSRVLARLGGASEGRWPQ